jgi:hypothetical protein
MLSGGRLIDFPPLLIPFTTNTVPPADCVARGGGGESVGADRLRPLIPHAHPLAPDLAGGGQLAGGQRKSKQKFKGGPSPTFFRFGPTSAYRSHSHTTNTRSTTPSDRQGKFSFVRLLQAIYAGSDGASANELKLY